MDLVFFDLDKTLIAENSAKLWIQALYRERKIKFFHMAIASYWLFKYHLGFTKMDEIIDKALKILEGEDSRNIVSQTQDFYEQTIKHLYRPGALREITKHRQKNNTLSLLTSSFDGLARLVAYDLDFDHCLSTQLEIDSNGFYTGKTVGPPCFGANKVLYAKELAKKLNIPFENCIFYTDSASDIPLLNLVRDPIAVNPDPHLRARAQLNKWTIVDWGRP